MGFAFFFNTLDMKQLWFFFFLFFFFSACTEIPPEIPSAGGSTPGSDQERQVLIEEFTGVRCVNCPAGSAQIQDLLATYGERLVAVSIHAGEYSPPLPESLYDFRTEEGDQLIDYLGAPFGYPSAVINRKQFPGEFSMQLGQAKWAGYIAQELAEAAKVKIAIKPNYEESSRQLSVEVTVFPQEDLPDDLNLSLMITEDDITDYQVTPSGTVSDYEHRHVLRDMLTPYDGEPFGEVLLSGSEVVRHYSLTLPQQWVADRCHLVALVSGSASNKEVLQVHQVALK